MQCAVRDFGSYAISSTARQLRWTRPVDAELPAGATADMTKTTAADLASGILNQFGLVYQVSRYTPRPVPLLDVIAEVDGQLARP